MNTNENEGNDDSMTFPDVYLFIYPILESFTFIRRS